MIELVLLYIISILLTVILCYLAFGYRNNNRQSVEKKEKEISSSELAQKERNELLRSFEVFPSNSPYRDYWLVIADGKTVDETINELNDMSKEVVLGRAFIRKDRKIYKVCDDYVVATQLIKPVRLGNR